MTDVNLANRIIAAVYKRDGGAALDRLERELDASLSMLLDDLSYDFTEDGDHRMASRCLRAFDALTGRH